MATPRIRGDAKPAATVVAPERGEAKAGAGESSRRERQPLTERPESDLDMGTPETCGDASGTGVGEKWRMPEGSRDMGSASSRLAASS